MSTASGIAAQFGYAAETTWGVYQVPNHFVEFTSDGLNLSKTRVESAGIRSNTRVQRSDRFITSLTSAGGTMEFEVSSKGFGLLFKHWLGTVVTSTAPGGTTSKRHRCTIGDPFGLGLTLQVGRPDNAGTVRPFSYLGCKVTSAELSNSTSGYLMFKPTFIGTTEDSVTALASASYAASDEVFSFSGGAVTIGGSSVANVKDITITGDIGLDENRYFLGGAGLRQQPIANAFVGVSGTMTCEFPGLTEYNRFVNGTLAAVVATWTGFTALEGTVFPQVVATMPVCRFDGDTPNVTSRGMLEMKLPFKALYDGSQEPLTVDYITLDATP
jgi:hypothetical protein